MPDKQAKQVPTQLGIWASMHCSNSLKANFLIFFFVFIPNVGNVEFVVAHTSFQCAAGFQLVLGNSPRSAAVFHGEGR